MCGAMWDVEECIRLCFCMSHKYCKDAKAMQINRILIIKFDLSHPINPQNNRDVNQGILHLWPKSGDPSLNRWILTLKLNLVILAWRGDELSRGQASGYRTHRRTHRQTDAGSDKTRRPKLALGKKSTLNLWIIVNRKCFLNSKPMTRSYTDTFICGRSFLACQTFQISNFTSEYTQLTSQNAHIRSYKATYHDKDTIYY